MPRLLASLLVGWLATFALSADATVIRHSFDRDDFKRIQLADRHAPDFLSHLDEFYELDDFRSHRHFGKLRRHLAFLWHWLDRLERREGSCSLKTPEFCAVGGDVGGGTPQPGTGPFPVVPEPGTALLLAAGLAGLLGFGRRTRR